MKTADRIQQASVPRTAEEQRLYAVILAAGMYTGLGLLLITFALYISGLLEPAVPVDRLEAYWTLSVDRFNEVINAEYLHREHGLSGWWWISALSHGDYLNLVGIAVLSGITVVCFLSIIPVLIRKRDYTYAAIAAIEVMILALAASGILAAGGH